MRYWTDRAEVPAKQMLRWLGVPEGTYYKWRNRYGLVNEHNGWIPRDHWLEESEKQAIIEYHFEHPLEGYRRLTYMMIDEDVVAASATTVYRVLSRAGLIGRAAKKSSTKGTGFKQPGRPHRHWHVDISYLNLGGTFYYLCSVLDGYSRLIVHWEIREKMQEVDVETIVQRAREQYPGETPRIITDNGPQFVSRDFKQFIRVCGMTHVRTSPYYPQANGKLERYHRTLKVECLRPGSPLTLEDARRITERFVTHYNQVRLHSSLGYVTPADKLAGREQAIFEERTRKLEAARERRKLARQESRAKLQTTRTEDRALRGRNLSADPGAHAEAEADGCSEAARACGLRHTPSALRKSTDAENPRGSGGLVPQTQEQRRSSSQEALNTP